MQDAAATSALPSRTHRTKLDLMSQPDAASTPSTAAGGEAPSSEDPGRASRPMWRLLGYTVITAGIMALLLLSLGALWLVTAHQFLEETRGEWTQARRAAILELERHWIFGNPEAAAAYREAMAAPARIREPIRYAFQHPGDASGLRPLLDEALDPERARGLSHFSRWFGTHPRTLTFLDLSVQADDVFLQLDSLATVMEETGLPGALGDPEREELLREALDELHELDREGEALTEAIGVTIREWSRDLQVLIRNFLVLVAGVVLVVGVLLLRDAARRASRSEAEARESQATLAQVTNAIRQVFWLTPPDKSRMLYVSPAYEEIWGRPVEELYRDPRAWMAAIHPEDRSRVQEALPLQEEGKYDIEYRIRTPEGRTRWIWDKAFPVRDGGGRVVRVTGVAEDITHRKEMEDEILRTRSLRSVGRLAGGIAHQFNNLLTAMVGRIQLLRMDRPDDGDLQDELQAVEESVERSRDLTRGLLAFAREQTLRPHPVDLGELVGDAREMIRSLLPEAVELTLELGDAPTARVDPSYLRETLLNLAALARDALPADGTVFIRTSGVRTFRPVQVEGGTLAPGGWAILELEHTGFTIPPDARDRWLEPFGIGLGGGDLSRDGMELASLHGFVDQSGGGIVLEAGPRAGTVLRIFLPETEATPDDPEVPTPS